MQIRIFPSLISANLLNLESVIHTLNPHCDGYHIDIMDNHFVPNITWGVQFADAIDAVTIHPLWIHLMVEKPELMIPKLKVKPKSIITFHLEVTHKVQEIIKIITDYGWIVSIALNPSTPLEGLYPYVASIKHILLMSVEPGFSGQTFIHDSLNRLEHLVAFREQNNLLYSVGMDGGISIANIQACVVAGAQDFAIASGIFSQRHPVSILKKLYTLVQ